MTIRVPLRTSASWLPRIIGASTKGKRPTVRVRNVGCRSGEFGIKSFSRISYKNSGDMGSPKERTFAQTITKISLQGIREWPKGLRSISTNGYRWSCTWMEIGNRTRRYSITFKLGTRTSNRSLKECRWTGNGSTIARRAVLRCGARGALVMAGKRSTKPEHGLLRIFYASKRCSVRTWPKYFGRIDPKFKSTVGIVGRRFRPCRLSTARRK